MRFVTPLLPLSAFTLLMAQAPAPSVQEILDHLKAASGGAAWDRVQTLESRGRLATGGMKGTFQAWEDLKSGRTKNTFDLDTIKGSQGFDGAVSWSQNESGDVQLDEKPVDPATTYWTTRAYWFPERSAAKAAITYLGLREGGFHVLQVKTGGAQTDELWVDARTWLPDRISGTRDGETQTTFFSDYRTVDGLKLPFRTREPKQDANLDTITEIETFVLNPALPASFYQKPIPHLTDAGMDGQASSCTVPMEFLSDHIFIYASINGQKPMRFILDTGGVNILTPSAAKALGLVQTGAIEGGGVGEQKESFGLTKVYRVQVGQAWMKSQSFYVIQSLETVSKDMGIEVSGLLGYELIRRFVTRVDYDAKTVTLSSPEGWSYQGHGSAIPFIFNAHHPRVQGELDGIPGAFDIDTGSGATLDVFAPFAKAHQLKEKAAKAIHTITGQGAGGEVTGDVIRARELKVGGVSMQQPIVGLSGTASGAFADSTAIGNVGQGFLHRFNLTFDYGKKIIYFEKNKNYDRPDHWNRLGFRLDDAKPGLVLQVFASSDAEKAGLKAGDRILQLNGRAIEQWTASERKDLSYHAENGTQIEVKVRSGDQERTFSLILEDLL